MSIKRRVVTAASLHYLVWLVMFIVVMALGFISLAIYLALAGPLGPAGAALAVGLGWLVLLAAAGGITWLVMYERRRAPRHGSAPHPQSHTGELIDHQLRPIIGDRAANWAQANKPIAMIGALSAGVFLASSPGMRRMIYEAAKPLVARRALQALQGRSHHD